MLSCKRVKRRAVDAWRWTFHEQADDLIAREWIAVALLMSLGAVIAGGFIGKDFWINLLASIALLGPGLFFTNVIVRTWQRDRATAARDARLMPLVMRLVESSERSLVEPLSDFFKGDSKIPVKQLDTGGTPLSLIISEWIRIRELEAKVREVLQIEPESEEVVLTVPGPLSYGIRHIPEQLRSDLFDLEEAGFNVVRAYRELRELEEQLSGMQILGARSLVGSAPEQMAYTQFVEAKVVFPEIRSFFQIVLKVTHAVTMVLISVARANGNETPHDP